ncbi:unnamed protein product [Prorocentrum cordatum]|uniref:Uncharacterized protein n=1 Tax=Prorocentrum cordatum TaxID=2364126 RepID=A0ABN9VGX0_9DINO|nr:unnamed protein product [Polarella glacialis]
MVAASGSADSGHRRNDAAAAPGLSGDPAGRTSSSAVSAARAGAVVGYVRRRHRFARLNPDRACYWGDNCQPLPLWAVCSPCSEENTDPWVIQRVTLLSLPSPGAGHGQFGRAGGGSEEEEETRQAGARDDGARGPQPGCQCSNRP